MLCHCRTSQLLEVAMLMNLILIDSGMAKLGKTRSHHGLNLVH